MQNLRNVFGISLLLMSSCAFPLNVKLNGMHITEDQVQAAIQPCVDEFYKPETIDMLSRRICKDYKRPVDTCEFNGVEAADYKWRFINECVTKKLLETK